jgi:hypothetical protein
MDYVVDGTINKKSLIYLADHQRGEIEKLKGKISEKQVLKIENAGFLNFVGKFYELNDNGIKYISEIYLLEEEKKNGLWGLIKFKGF